MPIKNVSWKNEHAYAAFDGIIRGFEKTLSRKPPRIRGIHARVAEQRIVQRFVQLLFYPYCLWCVKEIKAGRNPFEGGRSINLNSIKVDTGTSEIRLGGKQILGMLADFAWQWILAVKTVFVGYFFSSKWNTPATLVFGILESEIASAGGDKVFGEFCSRGPIVPLQKADHLLIRSIPGKKSTNRSFLRFCKNPVYEAVQGTTIGFAARTGLLARLLWLPFRFLILIIRKRSMAVLGKDLVQLPMINVLDKKRMIDSVIISNSEFFQQPLWMRSPAEERNFRVHEIHYSQNTAPFTFKDDRFAADFPAFRHVAVDEHWVWTEGYREYIQTLGHNGPIHVVGPILWYLPVKKEQASKASDTVRLAIFDITPMYDEFAETIGVIKYYYNTNLMIRFINDILESASEISRQSGKKVEVMLKSKRAAKKGIHDHRYEEFIVESENKYPGFRTVPVNENIFSFLDDCDLSVSIPYTSVPYVSAWLGRPAIYYDPSEELVFTNEPSPFIYAASGKRMLMEVMQKLLASK